MPFASRTSAAASSRSRVLPMPGSPVIQSTSLLLPATAALTAMAIRACSTARPTSGVVRVGSARTRAGTRASRSAVRPAPSADRARSSADDGRAPSCPSSMRRQLSYCCNASRVRPDVASNSMTLMWASSANGSTSSRARAHASAASGSPASRRTSVDSTETRSARIDSRSAVHHSWYR